jgi:DNA polymerase-3 subunit epsilon
MKFGLDFVALDLETATWNKSSICEIGIAIVKASQIVETKSWLVKPYRNWYDSFNISIHGITPEMTKNCPAFKEVWKEVRPYLENQVVVAHNTAFDMYALKYAFEENGMPYPNFRHFCSYRVARYCFKDTYSYSLPIVCDAMGIPFNSHHRAGADAEACAKVFIKSLELSEVENLEELQSKYEFRCGRFEAGLFEGQRSVKKYASSGKSIKEYVGDPLKIDEDSYFYQKSVCFTGTCQWASRDKLLQTIADIGGFPQKGVNKFTQILVVGQQDYRKVGEDGMSSKQEKAMALKDAGQDIEIMSEKQFLSMLGLEVENRL